MEIQTADEFIAELDGEAPQIMRLTLVVAMEKGECFVCPGDQNRLKALNDALALGGAPIGYVGLKMDGEHGMFYSCHFWNLTHDVCLVFGLNPVSKARRHIAINWLFPRRKAHLHR
jgi:hypothetical protein